jgi:hypothetical protein
MNALNLFRITPVCPVPKQLSLRIGRCFPNNREILANPGLLQTLRNIFRHAELADETVDRELIHRLPINQNQIAPFSLALATPKCLSREIAGTTLKQVILRACIKKPISLFCFS